MADINGIKVENHFHKGSLGFLDPRNWFRSSMPEQINILFIDDLDMPVVENLKKMGYRVKKVKDIRDIRDAEVKNSQVIFVDFEGVGKVVSPQHQGAGLVKELKVTYGNSKYVVLYTAQPTLPADTIMRSLFDAADARLRKDSDVTDFTDQIKKALEKLK
jgi:hypothetical protein